MGAMPASGERALAIGDWRSVIRWTLGSLRPRNNIDLAFPKAQRGFDRLDQSCPVFLRDRNAILNDLHTRPKSLEFWIDVDAHDFVIDPYPQISLLLKKFEELTRFGFRWNGNPESDKNSFRCAVVQYLVTD